MYLRLLYLLYVTEIKLYVLKLILCRVKAQFRLYNMNLLSTNFSMVHIETTVFVKHNKEL